MFLKELQRLVQSLFLFRGHKDHLRGHVLYLVRPGLELSHAFDAVGSPGATQEFQNQAPVPQQRLQAEFAVAIRRSQLELWCARSCLQGFCSILHLC
jgi:hypothetical protein